MLDKFFRLSEHNTTVRTELFAGLTTFLTMAYIIFLQPAVLSGELHGRPTGMDFDAVMTATCLAAALATTIMALYARYPIAQAPGMGENFMFVAVVFELARRDVAAPWQTALGIVFLAGVLFLIVSLFGLRKALLETISPSMRNAIAIGIGIFIAFIGLKNAGLIIADKGNFVQLNSQFASPDLIVFFFGLLLTGGLHALRVRGAILWGIVGATLMAVALYKGLPLLPEGISQSKVVTESDLMGRFQIADGVIERPKSLAPTFLKMDLVAALRWVPFILIFLFMDLFDTLGTLVGVSERAGLMEDGKLPRARQAMLSDAVGTVAGAALGTSTVTSFIESTAGVEQGGRTGLTALCTAMLFLAALFFSPLVRMVGMYPPITAAALVVVGSMMMQNVRQIDWSDTCEVLPVFLIIIGIPLTFSIADGLALGFIAYPIIKLFAGRGREVKPLMYAMAVVLIAYFALIRVTMSSA